MIHTLPSSKTSQKEVTNQFILSMALNVTDAIINRISAAHGKTKGCFSLEKRLENEIYSSSGKSQGISLSVKKI